MKKSMQERRGFEDYSSFIRTWCKNSAFCRFNQSRHMGTRSGKEMKLRLFSII